MDFKPSKLNSKLVSPFCPKSAPKSQHWTRPDIPKKTLTLRKKPKLLRKKSQESLAQSNIEINQKVRPRQPTIDYSRRSKEIPAPPLRTSKEKSHLNYNPSSTGYQNFTSNSIISHQQVPNPPPTLRSQLGNPNYYIFPASKKFAP